MNEFQLYSLKLNFKDGELASMRKIIRNLQKQQVRILNLEDLSHSYQESTVVEEEEATETLAGNTETLAGNNETLAGNTETLAGNTEALAGSNEATAEDTEAAADDTEAVAEAGVEAGGEAGGSEEYLQRVDPSLQVHSDCSFKTNLCYFRSKSLLAL